MKNKGKGLLSIILVAIIAMGGVACSSQSKGNEEEVNPSDISNSAVMEKDDNGSGNTNSNNITVENAPTVNAKSYTGPTKVVKKYVPVTNKKGEVVTDKKGKTKTKLVTEYVADNDITTTKKAGGKTTTKQKTTAKKTTEKNKSTTEPTTHYTTVPDNHNLPEDSFDEYMYTSSSALSVLQNYYGDDYVVNDYPEKVKGDNYVYAIFKTKDKYKIYYEVTVNLLTGKMVQKDTKTGKKTDIKIQ